MKINPVHFEQLKALIKASQKEAGKPVEEFRKAYQDDGKTDKRFRWDWLWAVPTLERQAWFDEVYQYANDVHIDTALRQIFSHAK